MCPKHILPSLQQLEGKTRGNEKAKELCKEIQEFKKDSQKSKTIKTRTVGGCLYFLMLFCFQHFPLGDVIPLHISRLWPFGPTKM
ncbi:hypothetical protein K1719_011114 [Acacia pycnantha]|nr:hypothetical protein K1719_011114 [Acacia pycnantha]